MPSRVHPLARHGAVVHENVKEVRAARAEGVIERSCDCGESVGRRRVGRRFPDHISGSGHGLFLVPRVEQRHFDHLMKWKYVAPRAILIVLIQKQAL